MTANFRSDNETPIAPAILDAIVEANRGTAYAYAEDEWSLKLEAAFTELFERECRVLPMPTGTVANAIALACVTPPWGSVLCHRNAHIYCDESGCPEFYGDGLRLVPIEGADGKLDPQGLQAGISRAAGHGVHSYAPSALSLTQCTETGTLYQPGELKALCDIAHQHDLVTHLDGARFGNAVAALGCRPADIACDAGVQLLSFGASKNGCMAAEALVLFNHFERVERAERLRKRGGHLLSKMRYVSAQLLTYLEDGLWLRLAAHANAQATNFAEAVDRHTEATLEFPVEANEVFLRWTPEGFARLRAAGIDFHNWPGRDDLARLVFGHSTTTAETTALIAALEH
jgi:threonine aldolase